jgi:hypothetical protein
MSGGRPRRPLITVVVLAAAGWRPAAADEPFQGPPEVPRGRSFSEQIADKLTQLGDTVDDHVGPLTLHVLDLRFDGRARRAHLRLRGETRYLSLRIDGDVEFHHGAAQVDARLELGIAGRQLRLELPDFEVVPRSFGGERYLEVRVPLLSGHF